jgi:hypothetical protein
MVSLMQPPGTSPAAARRAPVLAPHFSVMSPAGMMPGMQQLQMHPRGGVQLSPVLQQPPGTVLPPGFVLQQQQQQHGGRQGSGDAPGSSSQS